MLTAPTPTGSDIGVDTPMNPLNRYYGSDSRGWKQSKSTRRCCQISDRVPRTQTFFHPNHFMLPAPTPTCSQCRSFDRGLCRLRAEADWGDSSYVAPTRKACDFADLYPF